MRNTMLVLMLAPVLLCSGCTSAHMERRRAEEARQQEIQRRMEMHRELTREVEKRQQ